MSLDLDVLRAAPKVSLHDHLDGGLRPQTLGDLAGEIGHELPASTPEARRSRAGSTFSEPSTAGWAKRARGPGWTR